MPTDKSDFPAGGTPVEVHNITKGDVKEDKNKPTKAEIIKSEGGKKKGPAKGVKTPKQDSISQDDIEEEYGLSYALFKAFPELDDLLKAAVAGNWTASKFQVELRQTKWFKNHSDIWRENIALSHSDPATFEERLNNSITAVQNLAASVGAQLGDKALERLAKRSLLFGMNEDELRNILAKHVRPSRGGYGGELSSIESDLRSTALQNGVTLTNDQVQKWMKSIVRGDASSNQFITNIRNMAAQAFPLYGDQIKGGMDLADVANPYLQSMSALLEMAPGSVTLNDPTIRKALAGSRDSKGNLIPVNISEFEESLRRDQRWMYTSQAKDMAKGYASNMARLWGLI